MQTMKNGVLYSNFRFCSCLYESRVTVGLCDFERSPRKHVFVAKCLVNTRDIKGAIYNIQRHQAFSTFAKQIHNIGIMPTHMCNIVFTSSCVTGEVRLHSLVKKPLFHYILIKQIVVCLL